MSIPTAKDFVKQLTRSGGGRNIYSAEDCAYVAIEFAKLHSQAQAEVTSKVLDVDNDGDYVNHPTKNAIINAYPLTNII